MSKPKTKRASKPKPPAKTETIRRVRFVGGDGYFSHEIALASGKSPQLEPGAVYELPVALAEGLLKFSTMFEPVKGGS